MKWGKSLDGTEEAFHFLCLSLFSHEVRPIFLSRKEEKSGHYDEEDHVSHDIIMS